MEEQPVFNVINICMQWMVVLSQGYLLQYFVGSFIESRVWNGRFLKGRQTGLWVMVLYGVLVSGMELVLPEDYGSFRIFSKLMLTVFIVTVLVMAFYKAWSAITVFLIVTFMAVSELCFFIAYMLMTFGSYLTDFWVSLFDEGYFALADTFMNTVVISLTILQFIMYVVFLALTCFFLKKIVKSFREKEYPVQKREMFFILTPGLAGLLLCVLLRLIMITVEDEVPRLLYDRHPPLRWLVPAILFLSLMSILYVVKLFQDMIDLSREKNSRIILEKQIKNMQEHVEEMEHIYSGMRSLKHDMKNTLAVVMQLALGTENAENAELKTYLNELNQTMDRLEMKFRTGNTVVDTLLNMKYHEITRSLPKIQINADRLLFPANLNIQSYDIGVILGNALDNAFEACQKLSAVPGENPYICLSSFQKGKMFFIEIENSFDGKLIRRKHSEFPVTDKEDKKSHGIGLTNIKSTAEKYGGAVDWSVNKNVFMLTVMMKNERRNENEFRLSK